MDRGKSIFIVSRCQSFPRVRRQFTPSVCFSQGGSSQISTRIISRFPTRTVNLLNNRDPIRPDPRVDPTRGQLWRGYKEKTRHGLSQCSANRACSWQSEYFGAAIPIYNNYSVPLFYCFNRYLFINVHNKPLF